jgi:hypothetical protein
MPEPKNYVFGHTELTELLIKNLNIHEGLWGIYFEFGLGGANIPTGPDGKTFAPAAISFIQKVGIQKLDTPSNLSVDASIVNPLPSKKPKEKKKASSSTED